MTAPHTRAHIRLMDQNQVIEFIQAISDFTDQYAIEDLSGRHRVNAKSVIGVMYTMLDFPDEQYLVNDTRFGVIPACIDKFRVHE